MTRDGRTALASDCVRIGRIARGTIASTAVVVGDAVRIVGPADDAVVLECALGRVIPTAGTEIGLDEVRWLPPLAAPPSVRDFYAFERHVATSRRTRGLEVDPGWYDAPAFYFTNPAAVIGHGDLVRAPARCAELDFELEVALVLGRPGTSLDDVAGFTVLNDWSARDLQRGEMRQQLGPAKGKDFATSVGPWLVTPDELGMTSLDDVPDLAMTAAVNGREVSRGSLAELWWSWAELLAYAAESTALRPGDVLGSGTVGTGCLLELGAVGGREAYPWLVEGDEVVLCVDRIGTLSNTVGPPRPAAWRADPQRIRPPRV